MSGVPVQRRGSEFLWQNWSMRLHEGFLRMFPEAKLLAPNANGLALGGAALDTVKLALSNVEVSLLPVDGTWLWRRVRQVVVLWRALGDADLVCLDIPNETSFWALLVCRLRERPFYVRILGDWGRSILLSGPLTRGRKIKASIGEWMANFMVRQAPLVRVQGDDLFAKYVQVNPVAVKASFVHSTLSRDLFHQRDSEPFHEPIRILSVSGLVPLKGLDVLLRAIPLISARGPHVEWWCVGDGPARESLLNLALSLGVSERIRFLGYVPFGPELFRIYKEADILVHPSLTEGVPNALLEAMAHSLPVIASAVGGIPGLVADGVYGLLVTPGRPEQIADAICRLAQDHDLVIRLRRGAFNRALEYRSDVLTQRARRQIEATFGKIANAQGS